MNPKLVGMFLVILAVVLAAGTLAAGMENFSAAKNYSRYSAVYLSSGDMYFGVLSWAPKPHLSNVWLIQRQVDQSNQTQLSVAQFTKAFWSPVDEIYFNPKQIVWWSRLRNDSQMVMAMNNPALLQQQQQYAPQAASPQDSAPKPADKK